MKIGFIKQLIEIVEESKIYEIEITRFGTRIRISKNPGSKLKEVEVVNLPETREKSEKSVKIEEKPTPKKKTKEDNLHTINSPMVGTFYRAPAPDASPYVEEGDRIKKGEVVCIIEAMNIMNEIESDVSGEIVEVLVTNEEPVEYNQGLFVVKKS